MSSPERSGDPTLRAGGRRDARALSQLGLSELASRESRLRAIFASLAEGVVIQDLAGKIVECNASAERILGLSRDELLGRTSLDARWRAVHEDGSPWPGEQHPAMVTLRTGEPCSGVLIGLPKADGKVTWLSVHCQPLRDREGAPTEGVVTSFSDVTEMRRMREELFESQKLESVARLAGGIAHDFNNLLTAILSYAELGQEKLDPDSALAGYLRQIVRCGDQAATLTRQLLAFARRQPASPVHVDLCELLGANLEVLRQKAGGGVSVRLSCAPALWPVLADRGQLVHVLLNLVSNASHAMQAGGSLDVRVANIVLSDPGDLPPGEYVEVAVSDTGSGMSPAVLARAFEPFFTTKPVGEGAGLGLSTCYGIVRQHGGGISLRSQMGVGTTVTVVLPRTSH